MKEYNLSTMDTNEFYRFRKESTFTFYSKSKQEINFTVCEKSIAIIKCNCELDVVKGLFKSPIYDFQLKIIA